LPRRRTGVENRTEGTPPVGNAAWIEPVATGEHLMKKYECVVCGWVYDEEKGVPEDDIAPGTKFADLPDDFVCPECGAGKDDFEPRD
jgi:rubredoxin